MKLINRVYIYDDRIKNLLSLVFDCVQFRNLLLLFIYKFKKIVNKWIASQSLLYSLIADNLNLKKTKDKYKIKKLNEILNIVKNNSELKYFLEELRKQKYKIGNNYIVQLLIRGLSNVSVGE